MTGSDRLPAPPIAPREPSVRELHGELVTDDYAWMRDPDEPALHDYLAAERAYYDANTEHLSRSGDRAGGRGGRPDPGGGRVLGRLAP